jgi:hypothetical protein
MKQGAIRRGPGRVDPGGKLSASERNGGWPLAEQADEPAGKSPPGGILRMLAFARQDARAATHQQHQKHRRRNAVRHHEHRPGHRGRSGTGR